MNEEELEDALNAFWAEVDAAELRDQVDRVLRSTPEAGDTLLSMGTYYALSKLIPRNRYVYDLGCHTGVQSVFFRHHRQYIGVDLPEDEDTYPDFECLQLRLPNTAYYACTIAGFCEKYAKDIPNHPNFAICNFVPPWYANNEEIVRTTFRHCYVFYPMLGDVG